jgi:signal transduction histidine kinase
VIPEHALERSPAPETTAGFVARHEHIWLGLMLLTLHAATAWGIGAARSSAFLVAHFGLFLMWQPLWQGDGKVEARHVILMVLVGTLLATAGSWWLHALWLAALTALIGGGVPGLTMQRQRSASMLAALYVLALLLMWVVPQLSGQPVVDGVLTNIVRYGLPLIAAAILLVRPAPRDGAAVVVDLFYSVMLFLLVTALVLGSLVMVKTLQGQYLLALAQTLIVIAVALAGLSWLMSPKAGFAGFDQMLSRYLLSVGLPFEQWVQRLADIAHRENEPPQFLQATMAHLQALPWVSGLQWETPQGTGTSGRLTAHHAAFTLDTLKLRIHTRWHLSPAMLLHVRLLAQMIGHFYAAKEREALQRRNAYTQAIHETGSRLTHDVKNLLQSLQVLCTVAQDDDPELANDLLPLVKRQLPQIMQRLNATLEKLRSPNPAAQTRGTPVAQWWGALQQRHAHRDVTLNLRGELPDKAVPAEMFDNVIDNLLENALRKTAAAQVMFDTAAMSLTVTDTGEAVPQAVAATLFSAPVQSKTGLGVGLYHAARFAEQQGYTLSLAHNEAGNVCFRLHPAIIKTV